MTVREPDGAGTPRWVKVAGIIALVLVVLVVVMLIAGRGGHGPGRHATGEDGFSYYPAAAPGVTREHP